MSQPDANMETAYECVCTKRSKDTSDFFSLICGCTRCLECLTVEIDIGLDRKSWPPKCIECKIPIAYNYVNHMLSPPQRTTWLTVEEEYNDESPTYCARPDCGTYLPSTAEFALCPACNEKTCTACNSLKSWHFGGKCPDIIEPESLREMREKGFKPCPWCKQMIERIDGCDHMRCEPCGRNFCFNCGKKKGRSEMPCDCRGVHAWMNEAMEEMDPERQQDILDRIRNGHLLPEGFRDIGDLELLPFGHFQGAGRRVGEDEPLGQPAEVGAPPNREDQREEHGNNAGFNHWQAMRGNDRGDWGMFRPAFRGMGQRLGEAPVPAPIRLARRQPYAGGAAFRPQNLPQQQPRFEQNDIHERAQRPVRRGVVPDTETAEGDESEDDESNISSDDNPILRASGFVPRPLGRDHPVHGVGRRLGDAPPENTTPDNGAQQQRTPRLPPHPRPTGNALQRGRVQQHTAWALMGQGHRLGE